ncbi:MAG: HPP family protein, partial [Methylococcaceae bacterium]
MNINQWLRFLTVDPVNLSRKGKGLSVIACFVAILIVAWVTREYRLNIAAPIIIASMGASAVILFIIPNSPLAQPWPLVGGHIVSATVGVACAQFIADTVLASAFAVGASVLAMLLFRCLHPPGAATALTPIMGGHAIAALGYSFVLAPVGLNVAIILIMAIAMNRWMLGYQYPLVPQLSGDKKNKHGSIVEPLQRTRISEQELEQALGDLDRFMDVTPGDLSNL